LHYQSPTPSKLFCTTSGHESDSECEAEWNFVNESPDFEYNDVTGKFDWSSFSAVQLKFSFFLLVWTSVYNIPLNAVNVLWKIICWLLPDSLFQQISLRTLRKKLFEQAIQSKHFVVCSGCSKLHTHDDCITTVWRQGRKEFASKSCSGCGTKLLESVEGVKSRKLRAKTIFPYLSVIESLRSFMARKDFEELCQRWRSRPVS
jgi:hypothetical protein